MESYKWNGFKILFSRKKDGTPYASVLSGSEVLKFCSDQSMEKVKDEVRDFLKDQKNIEKIIKTNHEKFLKQKGIENPERIGIFENKITTQKRVTYCWNCKEGLSSYKDYSCKKCRWLLCTCGACGCAYSRSN